MEKTVKLLTLYLVVSLSLLACKPKQAATDSADSENPVNKESVVPQDVLVQIKTEPCFGECPVYTLTIYQDSTIEYFGRMFVKKKGEYRGVAEPHHMEEVKSTLQNSGFFNLDELYDDESLTDLPTTTIMVRLGDRNHKVRGRYGEPSEFVTLSNFLFEFIDELPLSYIEKE